MTVLRSVARVGGQRLFYREAGRGLPVIALHPGPSLDGSVFLPWLEPLARRHRLIAVDLPGCGRSTGAGPGTWTFEKVSVAVEGFAASLGLESYALLGHSFGGFVALTLAVRRPSALVGVIASSTAASASALEGMRGRVEHFEPEHLRQSVLAAFAREASITSAAECRAVWAEQLPFFLAEPRGALVDDLRRRWAGVAYRPDVGRHEDWGPLELLGALAGVRVPVLALAGSEDRAIPPSGTAAIADAAADCRFVVIEGAGHFPFAERPDRYVEAVASFLDGIG